MRASSTATTMSQASASVAPKPTAAPFTRAMIGTSHSSSAPDDAARLDHGLPPQALVVDHRLHVGRVAAGAEGLVARAGHDHHVDVRILLDVVPDAREVRRA